MGKPERKPTVIKSGPGSLSDETGPLESDHFAGDGSGPILIEDLAEVDALDPISYAYSLPGEDFRVELYRLKPTTWRGQDISGYCADLDASDTPASIRERFGGGLFQIIRRASTGKLQWARRFKIAGNPVLSSSPDPSQSPSDVVPTKNPDRPVTTINLGGVELPITGDMGDLQKMILFVKAVKTVFPDPPDYNSALLGALLEKGRERDDPLELLSRLRTAVPEIFSGSESGSSGGDANLYSLLQEAIKQAGGILGGMAAARRPAVARPMPARPAIPAPSPVVNPTNPDPEKIPAPESEADLAAPSPQQIALAAVSEIVKAFCMDQPQPAADVVAGLDLVTGIAPADRGKLAAFKGALASMAERNLPEYIDDLTPETAARFKAYFSEVFDLFVDESRPGMV